jgi:hypothetical protein
VREWQKSSWDRIVARAAALDAAGAVGSAAKADRENKNHWFRGKTYDYESLLKSRAPASRTRSPWRSARAFLQCRAALERSAGSSTRSRPTPSSSSATTSASSSTPGLTPAITIYRGAQISNVQHLNEDAPGLNIAEPANSPAKGALSRRDGACRSHPATRWRRELRPRAVGQTPSGAPRGGIPHAYGFFYHTILQDQTPPSVPIILNVHFPHNTPKIKRCLELGRGLRAAIESFDGFKRVR